MGNVNLHDTLMEEVIFSDISVQRGHLKSTQVLGKQKTKQKECANV